MVMFLLGATGNIAIQEPVEHLDVILNSQHANRREDTSKKNFRMLAVGYHM